MLSTKDEAGHGEEEDTALGSELPQMPPPMPIQEHQFKQLDTPSASIMAAASNNSDVSFLFDSGRSRSQLYAACIYNS